MAMSIALSSITDSFATRTSFQRGVDDRGKCLPPAVPSQQVIFGRNDETATLLKAYQSLLRTTQSQTVIVHGSSGSGKTALVDTLLGPVFETSGYFVTGKYFQNEAVQEPFSAIMAAFSDLCDLVVQSDDFDEAKQKQIAKALDAHAGLLVKAVTNFTSLVGVIEEIELEVSSNIKFKVACKAFLRTLASHAHPVVIFLDDIQWADEESIALIQMLLQESDLSNVMLILAYRDEEPEVVEDILYNARDPIDIALSNLDAETVFSIVTSLLGPNTEEIELLSELVAHRTFGNPFHIFTFLDIIKQEGLITYETSSDSWLFNVDEIKEAIMVSESLADLLTRKIDRISDHVKEVLKVASLIGYHFDDLILRSIICSTKQMEVKKIDGERLDSDSMLSTLLDTSLAEAVTEGFIEKIGSGYHFTHDKLQSAFQSLIGSLEESELHKLVGETFLIERATERSYIYKAAVHLNSVSRSDDHQERARLARINTDAAKYCVEISAFDRAIVTLYHGLDCLSNEERWYEDYCLLTFEMMEALARNQYIIGKFEDCKETIEEALCHNMTTERKINFQLINIEVRLAGNEIEESLMVSCEALAALGIKTPRKVTTRLLLAKLLKVKWMLKNKTDEDILNLPPTEDPMVAQSVKLLVTMSRNCMMKEEVKAAMMFALMALELTLKKGMVCYSPGLLTFYGLIALVLLRNWNSAYRFGKLALATLNRMESKEAECFTVGVTLTMLTFRREPFKQLVEPLRVNANSGFKSGHITHATYCNLLYHNIGIELGAHLANIEEAVRESYATIVALSQDGLLMWFQPTLQYVLNMQTDDTSWQNISILSGEFMDEEQCLGRALERNDTVYGKMIYVMKARIACDFGQFELAESYFDTMAANFGKHVYRFSIVGPAYYFDVARTYFSLYWSSRKRRHLKKGRQYMKLLQKLADDGCLDAKVRLTFLVTQNTLEGKTSLDDSTLRTTYQYALNCFVESEYVVLEGLLSEKAGVDFARRGLLSEAQVYFDRALFIYGHKWGAMAKYNKLQQTMRFWAEPEGATNGPAAEPLLSGLCIDISSK